MYAVGMARAKDQSGDRSSPAADPPPSRLPKNRPAPEVNPEKVWRELPTGSIKVEARRLRQIKGYSQQQVSDLLMTRPPEMGGRWKQAEIQKFEAQNNHGRPITDEVRMILEDAYDVPWGTLLAMAGWIDDLSLWAPAPNDVELAQSGEVDPWARAAERLFHGDPFLTPAQADHIVEVYRTVRAMAKANAPTAEVKKRAPRRRLQ